MTMLSSSVKSNSPKIQSKQVRPMHYGCVEIDSRFMIRRALDRTFSLIFGESALSGKSFLQLIQKRTSAEDYKNVGRVLLGILQQKIKPEDLVKSNPLDCIHIQLENGQQNPIARYIRIELKKPVPQYQDDAWVIIVHDISKAVRENIKQRQEKKRHHKPQVSPQQDLLQLIENDRYEVEHFIKTVTGSTQDLVQHLSNTRPSIDNANDILCLVQQIKSEAKELGLGSIITSVEKLEVDFSKAAKNKAHCVHAFKQLPSSLKRLIRSITYTKNLHKKLIAGNWYKEVVSSQDFLSQKMEAHIKAVSNQSKKRALFVNDGYSSERLPTNLHDIVDKITRQLVSLVILKSIEETKTRINCSKTPYGCVHVSVTVTDQSINVIVRDDGRGLNAVKIKEAAIASGLFSEETVRNWNKNTILNALFTPGFATSEHINYSTGNGVKLESIKQHMEHIGGDISVSSIMGQFTEFSLSFPIQLFSFPFLIPSLNTGFQIPEPTRVLSLF